MITLDLNIPESDIHNMVIDITKIMTILLTVHLLIYSIDNTGQLFDTPTLKLLLYSIIGIIIYHSAIKRFFVKPTKKVEKMM